MHVYSADPKGLPCWKLVTGLVPFQGANYIHPLKQRKVKEFIDYVNDKYPEIDMICIFGSSVTPYCHPGSDIDVVIGGVNKHRFVPPDNDIYDIIWADSITPGSSFANEITRKGVVVYG